jgi:hypothetical protein
MQLSALHAAVRGLAHGDALDSSDLASLTPVERAAVVALRDRLAAVGGRLDRLSAPADGAVWLAPPAAKLARA